MSLLKAIKAQLGLSNTAAQNFTLTAEAADGTMKLARGNAGATTQDIITIASNGEVDFPQMIRSLSANGYQKLPGGLILQWGKTAVLAINGTTTITFPITFPTVIVNANVHVDNTPATTTGQIANAYSASVSGMTIAYDFFESGGVSTNNGIWWFALGY